MSEQGTEQQGEGAPKTGEPAAAFTMGGSVADLLEDEAAPLVEAAPAASAEGNGDGKATPADAAPEVMRFALPAATDDPLPPWVKVPRGFKIPRGRRCVFVFFKLEHTDKPSAGHRQAIVWSLTPEDEKFAFNRAQGDANRAPGELAKQMLRAVDGFEADWSGMPTPGSVDKFWREIGPKYRDLLVRLYAQLHVLTTAETDDFFENCVAVRSMG